MCGCVSHWPGAPITPARPLCHPSFCIPPRHADTTRAPTRGGGTVRRPRAGPQWRAPWTLSCLRAGCWALPLWAPKPPPRVRACVPGCRWWQLAGQRAQPLHVVGVGRQHWRAHHSAPPRPLLVRSSCHDTTAAACALCSGGGPRRGGPSPGGLPSSLGRLCGLLAGGAHR